MGNSGFRDRLFENFIFPKRLILDQPGIVINKVISKLSGVSSSTRVIFFFEETFSELYKDTVAAIGKRETSALWYRIGKEVGVRYLSFARNKRISRGMIPSVLRYVFDVLAGAGLSFAEEIVEGSDEDFFSVRGRHPLIARITGDGSFLAGILAGILSVVYGENFEAECFSSDPELSKFIASRKKVPIHIPTDVVPHQSYSKVNFSTRRSNGMRKYSSLSDFMRFKKVWFDDERSNWCFEDRAMFPSEVGLFDLISENYKAFGIFDVFEKSYKGSTRKMFEELLSTETYVENRIRYFSNFCSAFGWGIPYFTRTDKDVIVRFENPPFSKYGSESRAFFVNGALDAIFARKFELDRIIDSEFFYSS